MSDSTEQIARETLERVTRLESRMVQLGDHVGANLRTKQRIEIVRLPDFPNRPYVRIDSLDVSISRILTELRQANLRVREIDVYIGEMEQHVITLYPPTSKG